MSQTSFNDIQSSSKLESLSRKRLIEKYTVLETEFLFAIKEIYRLKNQSLTDAQIKLFMSEQLAELNQDLYGASSERYKKPEKQKEPVAPKPRIKKPSERYPNIPVREVLISISPLPSCTACGSQMSDSGMTEDSEQLNVISKKYEVILQKRTKYRCQCQGCITTAPLPARIVPGSTYSDEMIQDVVLSKYCDLIPVERYAAMAKRSGLKDLPPQSLIDLSHQFADFVMPVYELIKNEILKSKVLHADETPHKMLEGSSKKTWYLWGFSNPTLCFLECHNTRSADVASDILLNSDCETLVTDVYAGYGKAIKVANEQRIVLEKNLIKNANCNAHARRYFFKPRLDYKEAEYYLEQYHKIYQLNSDSKNKSLAEILELRSKMRPYFEAMKTKAFEERIKYPNKNKYAKALNYFLNNFKGLTLFLDDPDVPIDNNLQERLLRSHVVGRKTWYGTHSERGAKTASVLFTLVETCKLNNVNPRKYFKNLVEDLLIGKKPYTPRDFEDLV